MAPSEKRGSHEEDPVYRRADGDDPPRGRSAARPGGGQKARRQRPDALCLAETLRHVGARRCEAAAAARAGERPAEKDGGRSRSGDRRCSRRSPEKNGRRTRAPAAGRVCTCTRSVGSPRVRLALRRTVHAGLPVAAGRPGCPGAGRDASSGGAVSAVRLSPDSDFPKTRRGTR